MEKPITYPVMEVIKFGGVQIGALFRHRKFLHSCFSATLQTSTLVTVLTSSRLAGTLATPTSSPATS